MVKYISDLPAKDRERFRLFVESPYFNQHQKTIDLLDLILDSFERPSKGLKKEKIYLRLFPGTPYDEQQLYNVMSYLKKLFHQFLSIEHVESNELKNALYTVEYAYDHNLFDILKNRGKQLEKKLAQYPHHSNDYYFTDYRLHYTLGYYGAQYEDRSKSELFRRMLDSLDRFYMVEKLRNACHLTANMIVMNTRYDFILLDEMIAHISAHWADFEKDYPVLVYYTILMSLRDEDNPAHYLRLKEMLEQWAEYLSQRELGDLYSFANNYCIRQINLGQSLYQRELFDLYKQGLKTGLLYDNGLLSEWVYKNVTALGCSLKEFEWTEDFIQTYREKLSPHRRDNAYNYNLAHLYYSKKMYSEALSALLLVQFTDVKYHLNTTFLMLRTYYALQDTEALMSLIETFRIYVIRNQKMTADQKRGYTNFLRFAKKLVMLKHNTVSFSRKQLTEKLEALYTKIEGTNNVINRYWLLEECRA